MSTAQLDSKTAFDQTVDEARTSFLDAKRRLLNAFATTPDDRIDWSPSPTSRTPAQVVGHAAMAIKNIRETLDGNPPDVASTEEAEILFRKEEEEYVGRAHVLGMLEASSAEYLAWLDALTPDRLETMVKMPFGFGFMPLKVILAFPALHTQSHVSQLDYIQTIYGDRNWHMQM